MTHHEIINGDGGKAPKPGQQSAARVPPEPEKKGGEREEGIAPRTTLP